MILQNGYICLLRLEKVKFRFYLFLLLYKVFGTLYQIRVGEE